MVQDYGVQKQKDAQIDCTRVKLRSGWQNEGENVLIALTEQKWRCEQLKESVKMLRFIERTKNDVLIDRKKIKIVLIALTEQK